MEQLDSGQRVMGLAGRGTSVEELGAMRVDDLRPEMFGVEVAEVEGYAQLSKSRLKGLLKEAQFAKYTAFRRARISAAAAAREAAVAGQAAKAPSAARAARMSAQTAPADAAGRLAVALDCCDDYDALMTPREARSLSAQAASAYAATRKLNGHLWQSAWEAAHGVAPGVEWDPTVAAAPGYVPPIVQPPPGMHLMLTGLSPARVAALRADKGSAFWPVVSSSTPLEAVFSLAGSRVEEEGSGTGLGRLPSAFERSLPHSAIIYLSADADTVLTELQPFPQALYVVGGLVDRNRHKGVAHARAGVLGLATARLPIAEYSAGMGAAVLTSYHVFALMAEWWKTRDWAAACQVLPSRKRKGGGGGEQEEEKEGGEQEKGEST